IFGETCILSLQLQVFFFQRISLGLRPAFLWGQRLEDSLGPLPPPVSQQRRVQTFAAEKGAQATSRRRSNFGFFKDALFVLRCVGPPLRYGNYLGIRPRSRHRIGARFGCRCTALRLARRRASASFRGSQTPRGKSNTKRIPVHL